MSDGEIGKVSDQEGSRRELSEMDVEFIRVLEDLIDALLANGTLRVTDLPPQAMAKLDQRKRIRQRLRGALDLIGDDDSVI